jgi:type I restriction enzyme S subunit
MYIDVPFWTVDTMFYTEMKYPFITKYAYLFIKEKDLESMNVGTAVPSMTIDILNNIPTVIPPQNITYRFDEIITPIFAFIKQNVNQTHLLAAIRDTLLPKLMSGEIDVSKIKL